MIIGIFKIIIRTDFIKMIIIMKNNLHKNEFYDFFPYILFLFF